MSENHTHIKENVTLADKVLEHTGVNVLRCYQCGKCTASCPMANAMDYPPSHLLRMLQAESPETEDILLRSETVWLCVTCEMCLGRCPQDVDLPLVMAYLKRECLRQNKVNPKSKHIVKFHRAFLDTVNRTGRLYELGFILDYNTRSGKLLHDASLAPSLYMKGKLRIFPDMVKDMKNIKKIFKKTKGTVERG